EALDLGGGTDDGVVHEAAVLQVVDRSDLAGHAHPRIVVVGLQSRLAVPGAAARSGLVGGEDVGRCREGRRGGDGGGKGEGGKGRAHGNSRSGRRQVVGALYRRNMRQTHGWVAACLAALILAANPATSAPRRVVSTFLCTDEYVYRLVPRDHIAALSFEATDRSPVVSTIADAARGIRTIRPSAETVLTLKPDLVVMYAFTMPALHAALA